MLLQSIYFSIKLHFAIAPSFFNLHVVVEAMAMSASSASKVHALDLNIQALYESYDSDTMSFPTYMPTCWLSQSDQELHRLRCEVPQLRYQVAMLQAQVAYLSGKNTSPMATLVLSPATSHSGQQYHCDIVSKLVSIRRRKVINKKKERDNSLTAGKLALLQQLPLHSSTPPGLPHPDVHEAFTRHMLGQRMAAYSIKMRPGDTGSSGTDSEAYADDIVFDNEDCLLCGRAAVYRCYAGCGELCVACYKCHLEDDAYRH